MNYALRGFFASRILVGLIVGLIYALSMPVLIAPSLKLTLFMTGFCTIWATYLINVYTDHKEDALNKVGMHVAVSPAFIALVMLGPIPLLADKTGWSGLVFFPVFLGLCLLYSVKIPFVSWRVKDIFLLKNIYPGFIVILGMGALRYMFGFPFFAVDLFLVFLIYYGNEILWDIRDMEGDKAGSTLPQRIGVFYTKLIVLGIYAAVLVLYALNWPHLLILAWFPLLIVSVVTLIVKPNKYPMVFHIPILAWAMFLLVLICL